MKLKLLLVAACAAALPIEEREDTVYQTTTQAVGWAQLFGLLPTSTTVAAVSTAPATTAATVAATTAAAVAVAATSSTATATTTSSGGLLSLLLEFFSGEDDDASTSTETTATATETALSSSGGWFSSLLLSLFGGSSSSSGTSASTATASTLAALTALALLASLSASTSTSSTSGGLLAGLFGLSSLSSDTLADSAATSTSTALSAEIAKVAAYAEEGAGITYSPYTKSGLCKTASEVKLDIEMLLAYKIIRLYSVDCLGIENVVAAISSLQKLFLGIWTIDAWATDLPSMAEQVLTGSRGWDAVHTVSIGNEVVNLGTNTVAQVKSAVSSARLWFKSNASDYSGYIVAVDTLAAVMADSSMCDISDYLAVNCHPYFSGVEALTSGTWLKTQADSLQSLCNNGKDILITESGWPTYGDTIGLAVPSEDDQYLAIKAIATEMGSEVIMFTTYNDYWKDPGAYNVEQHWGIYGNPSV